MARFYLFCFLVFISYAAYAQSVKEVLVMQTKAALEQGCDDSSFQQCMQTEAKQCKTAVNSALELCDHLMQDGSFEQVETSLDTHWQCMQAQLTRALNVSIQHMNHCEKIYLASAEKKTAQTPQSSAPPSAYAAKIDRLDLVTLPIYQPSSVLVHIYDPADPAYQALSMDGSTKLGNVSITSSDSAQHIAQFYRKQLRDYKEYPTQTGMVFLKNGPKSFDLDKDILLYATTPHVMIEQVDPHSPLATPGMQTVVEIMYEKN
ncbi:MAG: hypothetical protein OEZ58_05925 [Gammaproteobacteria bacterium]|nr:hypothetical protein [Gammaproteobacteria bacterium]MDH5728506.1 hypothetical protein [Gammaproteobacteria bacterium]